MEFAAGFARGVHAWDEEFSPSMHWTDASVSGMEQEAIVTEPFWWRVACEMREDVAYSFSVVFAFHGLRVGGCADDVGLVCGWFGGDDRVPSGSYWD